MDAPITRVLLVDDQTLYRESLRSLIDHWPEFTVVAEASNGEEAILACQKYVPDLVLMDIQMPLMDGVAAAERIHELIPSIIIVMLTVATRETYVFDALSAGVRGYLLKDTPARQLRHYLHDILEGDAALSSAVTGKVIGEFSHLRSTSSHEEPPQVVADLNEREQALLRLVAKGLSNEEIAGELYLSVGTIKKSLAALMQKVEVDNRVQLAVYAVKANLS